MPSETTRSHIVEAADDLFYRQGFDHTSFADIAADVKISRGNFYYHFKTKDAILAAVIERRLEATAVLLAVWEQESGSPAERIRSFVNILVSNRTAIMAHGCPVGTLCSELAKLEHVARDDAARLFSLFRDWLAQQFIALGRPADAEALALHLLMRSQGVATLATAFRDEGFIRREVAEMNAWLDAQCPSASSSCRTS